MEKKIEKSKALVPVSMEGARQVNMLEELRLDLPFTDVALRSSEMPVERKRCSSKKTSKKIKNLESKISQMNQLISTMDSKIKKLTKKLESVVVHGKLLALSANRSNEFTLYSGKNNVAGLVHNKQTETRQILRKVKIDELDHPQEFFTSVKDLTFLTHRNISRYLDVWIELDCEDYQDSSTSLIMYILTDYWDNRTLESTIIDGSFNRASRRQLFGQIYSAYEYLERDSIIHGYLQVNNIFIEGESTLKIGEFGLTWKPDYLNCQIEYLRSLVNDLGLSETDPIKEQILGYKVDIYSLGIIYFYMCYPSNESGFQDALHKMAYTCDSLSNSVQNVDVEDTKAIKTLLRCFKLTKGYQSLLGKCKIYLKQFIPDKNQPRPKKVRFD